MSSSRHLITAVGDAADINCWSGIPYHFWQAAVRAGLTAEALRLPMASFTWPRRRWNLGRVLRGSRPGGYQYSDAFLTKAEEALPQDMKDADIISFNQHFPRSATVARAGGRMTHYIDATFASFCGPDGLAQPLPLDVRMAAMDLERQNYAESRMVVTMARWAADSVVRSCGVPREKVHTILPGANLDLPPDYDFPVDPRRPGIERPLVLGFVGKDWERKGLPLLLAVRTLLEKMGVPAVVRAAGHCPPSLRQEPGLEFVGFIDKAREPERFLQFLAGCDLGCLFSKQEPLGISTLEFLRAGVPVTGFVVEGLADTLPLDASLRFAPGTPATGVAEAIAAAIRDEGGLQRMRTSARAWSPLVTWNRCLREFQELGETGTIARRVRPELGLGGETGATETRVPTTP